MPRVYLLQREWYDGEDIVVAGPFKLEEEVELEEALLADMRKHRFDSQVSWRTLIIPDKPEEDPSIEWFSEEYIGELTAEAWEIDGVKNGHQDSEDLEDGGEEIPEINE